MRVHNSTNCIYFELRPYCRLSIISPHFSPTFFAFTEPHALSSLMICTSYRSMFNSLSVVIAFSVQPFDFAHGPCLSAISSEIKKSSSFLLFERRKEEKEGFACSERNKVSACHGHSPSDGRRRAQSQRGRKVEGIICTDITSIFVLSRPNLVKNAGYFLEKPRDDRDWQNKCIHTQSRRNGSRLRRDQASFSIYRGSRYCNRCL